MPKLQVSINDDIINCLFCSQPIRLGYTWTESGKPETLRQYMLEPYSQHLISTSGKMVEAFIPHICKKKEVTLERER